MANMKTKIADAKDKIALKTKRAVAVGSIVLGGLFLASCSDSKNLTHNDFRGKALKERTIDELMQAKFTLENTALITRRTLNPDDYFVDELDYQGKRGDFNNLKELVNHELQIRKDTLVSKEEIKLLEDYENNLQVYKDSIENNKKIIEQLRQEKTQLQMQNNKMAAKLTELNNCK